MHLETEVAVIGVGAMGSAALWRLATCGVPAVGFERFQPGHDRGSSHGESRIYRTAYLEGPGYVPLAEHAVVLWRELERQSGTSLIIPNGALMIGPRNSSVISSVMQSIQIHHLAYQLLDEEDIHRRYPTHRIEAGEVAIFEENAGIVRPEPAIRTMVNRAERAGAQVLSNVTVERLELLGNGVRLFAGDAVCTARHAVVAAGTWLGKLLPELSLPLRVTRQIPGWYPVARPELFLPERFPVFLRDIGDHTRPGDIVAADSTFYGFPTLDGETIKVAIHREGPLVDPDHLERTVAPEELVRVQEYIELFLRGVNPQPVRTQVCMYTNTPDHDFLIGSPPGMPQVTILGGFSGHGFKFAPVVGEAVADLVTQGATDLPVEFLSPRRFLAGAAPATGSDRFR